MVNPTGRTLILQKLRLQWERVAIYITQMEKPTIGSAQTQKSTGKVTNKGEQGKTVRETGRNHMMGREEEQPGRALPITEISGCLCFCAPSHIYTHRS